MEFDLMEVVVQTMEFIWLVIVGLYDYCCSFVRLCTPAVPKSIQNEIILVTGAASGIGKEVCLLLVQNGARKLVLWDYNREANEKAACDLRSLGAEVFAYEVDVSDRSRVAEMAKKVQSEVGDVTMLYNNAGVTHIGNLLDVSDEQIERTIRINLLSHFWTLKAFLPSMIQNKRGHIVTTCSTLGLKGVKTGTAYAASKFGVRGYLEALESEIRHHPEELDIKFTTIYPFFVETPLIKGLKVTYRLGFLFRHFTPQYVAKKVVDGILHNTHSVYIPWHLPHLLFLENLGPRRTAERVIDFFIKDIQLDKDSVGVNKELKTKDAFAFENLLKKNLPIPKDLQFSSKIA